MKKILFILALILAGTLSAQDLTRDMTIALKNDSTRDVKALINDSNKNNCLNAGTRKATLLQMAVQMNSGDVAHYLITEAKVNVDQNCNNQTPLMWAAQMGRITLVEELLKAGADTSIKIDGKTALDLAKENKRTNIVALLK